MKPLKVRFHRSVEHREDDCDGCAAIEAEARAPLEAEIARLRERANECCTSCEDEADHREEGR